MGENFILTITNQNSGHFVRCFDLYPLGVENNIAFISDIKKRVAKINGVRFKQKYLELSVHRKFSV